MSKSSSGIIGLFNRNKWLYLLIGIIFFASGAFVLASKLETVLYEALGHFALILGEALVVFYIINVVLEQETRQAFVNQISNIVHQQEEKLVKSVSDTTAEVGRQEQILSKTISDVSLAIQGQEAQLREAFDKTAHTIIGESEKLTQRLNNDLFKIILSERTCPEIAQEMNALDFFKPGFLFSKYKMKFTFSIKRDQTIYLIQEDEFNVKNFSKTPLEYVMRFSTTETDSKQYEFLEAGIAPDAKKQQFKQLNLDDFIATPIKELKNGIQFDLKLEHRVTVQPGEETKAYLKLATSFLKFGGNIGDSIDDYAFTNLYMMPSTIEVTVPRGFEFLLFPTFPAEIKAIPIRRETKSYDLPFITPGQGYNFSLIKQS